MPDVLPDNVCMDELVPLTLNSDPPVDKVIVAFDEFGPILYMVIKLLVPAVTVPLPFNPPRRRSEAVAPEYCKVFPPRFTGMHLSAVAAALALFAKSMVPPLIVIPLTKFKNRLLLFPKSKVPVDVFENPWPPANTLLKVRVCAGLTSIDGETVPAR